MEDNFVSRVDKIFGSLGRSSSSTTNSSSLPSSLWSLSDAEIEKKKWNRERDTLDREDIPCSSSFDGFHSNEQRVANKKKTKTLEFEGDFDELDDDEEEENDDGNHENEDWDIRGSIGLDNTLDNEDEEDEFDKLAVGRENTREERTFMKDVTDHGKYLNSHNVLPNSCSDHHREPLARVNFVPDDDTLPVVVDLPDDDTLPVVVDLPDDSTWPVVVDLQVKASDDACNVKPILKRKENKSDMKSAKRVKFNLGCEDFCEQKESSFATVAYSTEIAGVTEDSSSMPEYTSGVPDYLRNPSKYIRYEFDSSSDLSEESNRDACMDFLNMKRKPNAQESEGIVDLPKSITFTPKKKTGDTEMKHKEEDAFKEHTRRVEIPLGIAAGEELENEACDMDEDVPETMTADKSAICRKPGRQYRAKISYDDSVA